MARIASFHQSEAILVYGFEHFLGLEEIISYDFTLINLIEGEQAQGFSYWCSKNAWIQLTPDVPQLELGSSAHPGCRRDTTMALIRFALASLPVFMLGKMYLKKK